MSSIFRTSSSGLFSCPTEVVPFPVSTLVWLPWSCGVSKNGSAIIAVSGMVRFHVGLWVSRFNIQQIICLWTIFLSTKFWAIEQLFYFCLLRWSFRGFYCQHRQFCASVCYKYFGLCSFGCNHDLLLGLIFHVKSVMFRSIDIVAEYVLFAGEILLPYRRCEILSPSRFRIRLWHCPAGHNFPSIWHENTMQWADIVASTMKWSRRVLGLSMSDRHRTRCKHLSSHHGAGNTPVGDDGTQLQSLYDQLLHCPAYLRAHSRICFQIHWLLFIGESSGLLHHSFYRWYLASSGWSDRCVPHFSLNAIGTFKIVRTAAMFSFFVCR